MNITELVGGRPEAGAGTSPEDGLRDRPRRLRRSPALRSLVQETLLQPSQLVYPAFVREDIDSPVAIAAMPGQVQETVESLRRSAEEAVRSGIHGLILFGIPRHKDSRGSEAWNPDGIVPTALRALRRDLGDECVLMADCCLDEYTDHGHCGVLRADGSVDNDETIALYAQAAVAQAAAGADVIAPSGMMDGQVRAIRQALDGAGFADTAILAYSAKYASVMYGPFRDAADCAPQFGDRRGYQMDPPNVREALRETLLDIEEGADMVMVKPALPYLDVIAAVRENSDRPVAAYCVSGEYAMLKHAAAAGAFSEKAAVLETLTCIRRAGADFILTYHAREAATWLSEN